jgi:hypothetical protein
MSETSVSVAGYLLFARERSGLTLRELRRVLPRVGKMCARNMLLPTTGAGTVVLAGQVHAFVAVPGTCYPGSLGQLLEGFVCTFLDSLRPQRPEACMGWRQAMDHWLNWPREMVRNVDDEFQVGPAEIFGVLRLVSRSFEGEVTRAVLGQRELALASLAHDSQEDGPWPRVMRTGEKGGE